MTAALAIADKVHALGLSTAVLPAMSCASACSIVFFAGDMRIAHGRLGVHQLPSGGRGSDQALQLVISRILDSFGKYGVDARVTKLMLTTLPEDVNRHRSMPLANSHKLLM